MSRNISESLTGRTVSGAYYDGATLVVELDGIARLAVSLLDCTVGVFGTKPS
jgi:hypothetical protein